MLVRITLALLCGAMIGCESAPKQVEQVEELPAWARPAVRQRIIEPEDNPAKFIPASARLYLRVDGLRRFRANTQDDPLVEYLNDVLLTVQPPGLWRDAGRRLGLDAVGVLDTYFGNSAAIVEQKIDGRRAVVVLSRAGSLDLQQLPGAVEARPLDGSPQLGPFDLYELHDSDTRFALAVGSRWLALVEHRHLDHLRHLLTAVAAGDKPLADLPAYRNMLDRLPTGSAVTMFSRNRRDTEHHALTVTRHAADPSATVDYLARIPDFEKYTQPPIAPGVTFGPLPNSTIAAATVNVLRGSTRHAAKASPSHSELLDALRPPVLLYIGSVPGRELTPDPGIDVPVLGLALPIRSDKLAAQLDSAIRMIHFILSLGELNPIQGVFGVRTRTRGDVTYHEADFGRALARRFEGSDLAELANLPESAGLTRLSFGRVGDWYVICSQRTFFDRWIDAAADPARRMTAAASFDQFNLEDRPRLLASAVTRAPELSRLVEGVADFYRRTQLDPDNLAARTVTRTTIHTAPDPDDLDKIESPLRYLAGALKHRRSFSVQMWSTPDTAAAADDDADQPPLLRARMHITGP